MRLEMDFSAHSKRIFCAIFLGEAILQQPPWYGGLCPCAHTRQSKKCLLISIAMTAAIMILAFITAMLLLHKSNSRNVTADNSSALHVNETAFSPPEEAIKHFISSVAANDLENALAACAVNEPAQGYNAEACMARIRIQKGSRYTH
jgi:ribosomal protein L12E/L44/L45/RPP1/RPP2